MNRGGATGAEGVPLARAIQERVYGRFGIRLAPEPVIVQSPGPKRRIRTVH